ncbi:hypothetical protein HXX76_013021 [Chlamydomonas incerta]|uniref:FAD dependent oxidoreductase domain-containing protein n=1 Tax=Chlamydomonas incerta TaxID=51695 RepID=A0A835SFH5_CHLIN|nr:hypothetical protein HXX76_013021 [Chlamydomonas incerta]|eukprot:KAG2426263.1 hypothetical protein HXX76_013021 [Chlamydomonas incerta]
MAMHHTPPPGATPAHAKSVPTPVATPTTSYWLKNLTPASAAAGARARHAPSPQHPPAPSRAAQLPAAADVVIIGGGIAGVSTAYHLRKSRPELQVVLLEARQLSHGATGRNGGLLWPALNAPWLKTAARYGPAEAQRMMAFELQCLREVTDFITAHKLEEEVRYSPFADGAFYVYDTPAEMEAEMAELELMQQFGIHTDVQPLGAAATAALLRTDTFAGAVRQPGVARVWAARLVGALARLAAAAGPAGGLTIAEGVRVAGVAPLGEGEPLPAMDEVCAWLEEAEEEGQAGGKGAGGASATNNIVPMGRTGGGKPSPAALAVSLCSEALDPSATPLLKVTTDCGASVLARRVLHCTNAYGSALLPELRGALVPVRNHVAATKLPSEGGPDLPLDAAFYARGGFVYWSKREDGRVVVGGFRDVVPGLEWGVWDDGALDPTVSAALHAYLPQHFPAAFRAQQQQQQHSGHDRNGPQQQQPRLATDAEWSGILGFTQDRFPFVGPVPGRRGQFVAAGFSGHGMTRTFTCGRVLADMVAGTAPPDPAFPAAWLPSAARLGPATPLVPGPEMAAGAIYT